MGVSKSGRSLGTKGKLNKHNTGKEVQGEPEMQQLGSFVSSIPELIAQQTALFPFGIKEVSISFNVKGVSLSLSVQGLTRGESSSRQPREDSENFTPPPSLIVEGSPVPALTKAESYELEMKPGLAPQLSDISKVWNGACRDCGGGYPLTCCKGKQKYKDNCAHFLSDALIRCGFSELLTDGTLYRCDQKDCECPNERRPIRAREMWGWFKRKAVRKHEKVRWNDIPRNSGWWAVFQLKESEYWGGHVIILDSGAWEYYGTCSYPDWDQYAYQW